MLAKIKISTRLFIAFGVLVALVVGLAGRSYISSSVSDGLIKGVLRAQTNLEVVNSAARNTLEARLSMSQFIMGGGTEAFNAYENHMAAASKLIDDNMPNVLDPKRRLELENLKSALEALAPKTAKFKDLNTLGISFEADSFRSALADYSAFAAKIDSATSAAVSGFTSNGNKRADLALKETAAASTIALVTGIMSTVLGLGIAAAVARSIIDPMFRLIETVNLLASGNTDKAVDGTERGDEIAPLASALDNWRTGLIETVARQAREHQELALREVRQSRVDAATKRFDSAVVGMLRKIKIAVEHLHGSANALSANAEQTQRQSAAVAAATEEANSNVETVSAAGSELSASISEISHQVTTSAAIARNATTEAGDAKGQIAGLAESAQKIGEVISLINNIASQTNLLALNATIESARAGESGKGFAVVAHEVKNLAGQTGKATEDIAAQIGAIQEKTKTAVGAIEGIAATIARLAELSTAIAGAVEEQGAATAEIARNVDQASIGTRQVANNISGVADAAAQTGQMAQVVFTSANDLLSESSAMESEVQAFLNEVRAA